MTSTYMPSGQSLADAAPALPEVFVMPTSFAQQRLWLVDQIEPGRATYNIPYNLRMRGPLDVAALENALSAIVERHETLRTIFDAAEGQPVQVVHPPAPVRLPVADLSGIPTEEAEDELTRMVQAEATHGFDLRRGPIFRATLVRLGAADHALLLTVHHIAADGWSMGVLQRELEAAYDAFSRGAEPVLPDLPIQYADYAIWQRDQLEAEGGESPLEYWVAKLQRPLPSGEFPGDRPRLVDGARRAGRVAVHVPSDVAHDIVALARETETTPFIVLLAAYKLLLQRYSTETDVIVGTPTAGRTRPEIEGLIGFFVNTLALRTDLSGAPSFRELVGRVRETVIGALARQDVPFDRLVEVVEPRRDRARNPLFQTMFSLQDMPNGAAVSLHGLRVTRIPSATATAKFDVQLLMHSARSGFEGILEYDTDLFDATTAERIVGHYNALLASIVTSPDASIDELDMFRAGERDLVVREWNATSRDYPAGETLVSLISAQAAATPDAIAVVSGSRSLTFATLDSRSTALAMHLAELGVAPGALVGICLERSLDLMIALVAVLKAGAGYVPIDPEYPAERVRFMLSDAQVGVLLTQSHLVSRLPAPDETRVVAVDGDWRQRTVARGVALPTVTPDDVAYMIYTSGSTGQPKGAINGHRGIVNRLRWMQDTYRLTESDVVLQKTPVSFDVSVWELFWPLITGAKLVLAAPGGHRDPAYVAQTIQQHGVTVCHFVPSMLRLFLAHPDVGGCTSLRDVMCSGEALPRDLQDLFYAKFERARLHNLYGPTECAVDVSYWECRRTETAQNVPIGRPVANTQLYVLDEHLRPVPVGIEGELYIGGVQVGLGYHDREALTSARFVPDPFAAVMGARMYRTGDRARWRTDGVIEYLGRRDGQVKLRGFRIELGEIETVLRSAEGIADCVVDIRIGSHGEPLLAAYFVATYRDGAAGDLPGLLRTHARAALPEFMVPTAYLEIAAVPRSPSGKVDRRALPEPGAHDGVVRHEYVPPRTTLEHELVHIWEQLLRKAPIGIRSDFFDLGGHSLLATRMLYEIERVRGQRLPLATLFEGATIEQIAQRLEAAVDDEREPDVVVLQEEGSATPFVFVHGDVRGGGWYCRRMASLIGGDVPLVVLPTLRPDGTEAPRTIEQMARAHVATLRRVQPRGPYRLGGFCVGGLIAYEMARQLTALGETVERVIVIDGNGSHSRFRWLSPLLDVAFFGDAEARVARRAAFLRRLGYYTTRMRNVRRLPRRDQARWVRTVVTRLVSARRKPDATRPDARGETLAFTVERVDRSAEFDSRPATQLLRAQERAASAYVPRRYRGELDIIWAADQFPTRAVDPTRGWSRIVRRTRVHTVSSAHVGLITYNLPALADVVRTCLEPEDAARPR